MEFKTFKTAVAKQFELMAKHGLFRSAVSKDDLWNTYLSSFPEGTNPIYKTRTEHDCNCCKQFVRSVGDVVAIIDGKVVSIWDGVVKGKDYQVVSNALSTLVKAHPIEDTFLHFERKAGTDRTLVNALDGVISWDHFFVNIPAKFHKPGKDIASALSETRAHHDVLKRSLDTITPEAVDTVLELITQNSLYRGQEHKATLTTFKQAQTAYNKLDEVGKGVYAWAKLSTLPGPVTRIRNTSIGTLLVDLSEGKDLEKAVRAFEAMVAPANYKRPTAIVTQSMIESAKKTIVELGLGSALERRYATIDDISINNILYANRNARKSLNADVFDDLMSKVSVKTQSLSKVEDVSIDQFLAEILPKAESIEVLVENKHVPHLVSLVAPADATANRLFKWDNPFSWSYNGDVTDSIKERVKAAGGNVTGDLCCRLAWFNHDDLDFHMIEPTRNEISFSNKGVSGCGGKLDVDMNAGRGTTREPVENIFYGNKNKMKEGVYQLNVNQWSKRETEDVGFEVEMDFMGVVTKFSHPAAVPQGSTVTVVEFSYSHKDGITALHSLPASTSGKGKEVWGITIQTFQPVNVVMLSPNYWDDKPVGNKHLFFMLEGCKNDKEARGFYNEFLTEELTAHRKVIEMVGAKMRTEKSEQQLSGLGFSSTQHGSVTCRVKGSFSRVINVVF